jgi:hypothetical protein
MATNAANAVFSIPELLEAVLLHVDQTTLLVTAQRVSKHWLGVITASTRLQQALFFKPIAPPVKPALAYSTFTKAAGSYSPPYRNVLPRWRYDDQKDYPISFWDPYVKEVVASYNPLLVKHFGPVFFNLNGCGDYTRADYFNTHMPWWSDGRDDKNINDKMKAELACRHRAFIRKGASWRRMLVSQPAPPALGYGWKESGEYDFLLKGYIDQSPSSLVSSPPSASILQQPPSPPPSLALSQIGLRFGILYDLVQYHACYHKYPTVMFRVAWARFIEPATDDSDICEELLRETSVIVQFYHVWDYLEREPADPQAWNSTFQSEDFQLPESNIVEIFRRPLYLTTSSGEEE